MKRKNLGGEKKKKMKTKNKTLAIVKIAIVLCSMFLVALPAIAAEQTMQKVSVAEVTASSEDDEPLGIYGNANMDDTIDMRDTTYIKLVIFGKKPETDLADANYDGKVSMLDVGQTKLIILGKEKKLTVIDTCDRVVTVNLPIKTIIPGYYAIATAIKSVGAEEKVIGVEAMIKEKKTLYPELSKLPSIGSTMSPGPDYEKIFELKPDLFILPSFRFYSIEDILEPAGITVVYFNFAEIPTYTEEMKKLGYILGKEDRVEECIDFYQGYLDTITERVEGLSEEDKPRVYFEAWADYKTFTKENKGRGPMIVMAGGINIADDLPPGRYGCADVDPEWVISQNPSIILRTYANPNEIGYNVDDPSKVKALREVIMNRSGFEGVDAVKKGDVYLITVDISCGGYFIGVPYMAKLFHPELFEDLDPQAIHQEFLDEFQHIDFNVYEHGIFMYPPPEEW
jgi:iron complex transport system substrate-binding protein